MPKVSRILIYPVKALPGVDVLQATLTASGAFAHDREYALFDPASNFVNGKRNSRIHRLDASCAIEDDTVLVTIRSGAHTETFTLGEGAERQQGRTALEACLTRHFGEPMHIGRNTDGGFPDDSDNPGPTLIAKASLAEVASWYPGQTLHDMRRRFRVNIEVADCPAFWEDQLYGDPGVDVAFRIGEVSLLGTNPCRRCVVPTRDPSSGDEMPGFQRTFVQQRRATLPLWAKRSRFDFYYRLSINTRANGDSAGKVIQVGDEIEILQRQG
jgi:uncharacterized protein YcbX